MSMSSSLIALSAALSVTALAVAVRADDDSDEESAPESAPEEMTTGDNLLLELTIELLKGKPGPPDCKTLQCCHTVSP